MAIWTVLDGCVAKTGAKVLQDGENVIANREFFWPTEFCQGIKRFALAQRSIIGALRDKRQADEIVHYLAPH